MTQILSNFPFWSLEFDENGDAVNPAFLETFKQELIGQKITDLFIFSHGWNNDHQLAMALYKGFFKEVNTLIDDTDIPFRRDAVIGTAGVIWPAIKWPDDEGSSSAGGAAGFHGDTQSATLDTSLQKLYKTSAELQLVSELLELLDKKERSFESLDLFKHKLFELMSQVQPGGTAADSLFSKQINPHDINTNDLFDSLSVNEPAPPSQGGAAGLSGTFSRLWRGAKSALRIATYWTMKERAGIVGQNGLGPLLTVLNKAIPGLKIYLIGHSFGARLVSYALKGLPANTNKDNSPVKLLYLLQGAFSHFAFADVLPFDNSRSGDLKGMAKRVDGPLVATFSEKDLAVGQAYRIASFVSGQDASAVGDLTFRWQGMGYDGAQEVGAVSARLGKEGTSYPFQKGKWLNLDGNKVIVNGGLPSGAHSDIVYPHTAWVLISAAGIK